MSSDCLASSLLDAVVASESPMLARAHRHRVSARGTGNRCGHRPQAPRFFSPPTTHAPHPKILVRFQSAIEAYFAHPDCLPSLNRANRSPRRQRSERREACVILAGTFIHYLDLGTLRIGIPHSDGTFQNLSMEFLAERAGLSLRRAERACRDLVSAGILSVIRQSETTASGESRAQPALRRLASALFKVFGLEKWLKRERDKALQRQQQREQRRHKTLTETEIGHQALQFAAAAQRRVETTAVPAPAFVPLETAPTPPGPNATLEEILAYRKQELQWLVAERCRSAVTVPDLKLRETAIPPPGPDATPEEHEAYRRAVGRQALQKMRENLCGSRPPSSG